MMFMADVSAIVSEDEISLQDFEHKIIINAKIDVDIKGDEVEVKNIQPSLLMPLSLIERLSLVLEGLVFDSNLSSFSANQKTINKLLSNNFGLYKGSERIWPDKNNDVDLRVHCNYRSTVNDLCRINFEGILSINGKSEKISFLPTSEKAKTLSAGGIRYIADIPFDFINSTRIILTPIDCLPSIFFGACIDHDYALVGLDVSSPSSEEYQYNSSHETMTIKSDTPGDRAAMRGINMYEELTIHEQEAYSVLINIPELNRQVKEYPKASRYVMSASTNIELERAGYEMEGPDFFHIEIRQYYKQSDLQEMLNKNIDVLLEIKDEAKRGYGTKENLIDMSAEY